MIPDSVRPHQIFVKGFHLVSSHVQCDPGLAPLQEFEAICPFLFPPVKLINVLINVLFQDNMMSQYEKGHFIIESEY